ncbi:MAG: hypothetical protein RIC93_07045 [Alphaproteobacteria bacterium]
MGKSGLIGLLLLSVALIALALPRMMGGGFTASHRAVVARLAADETVAVEDLNDATDGYVRGLKWHQEGGMAAELGALRLAQARLAGYTTPRGQEFLAAARAIDLWALELNPSQPYAWAHLLETSLRLDGIGPDTDRLLRNAILVAPYSPKLVWQRARLGVVLWPFLGPETRRLLQTQFLAAARHDIYDLGRLARRHTAGHMIRPALVEEPALRAEFDRIYLMRRDF